MKEIFFIWVNYNKYMVIESVVYIGMFNWLVDYFLYIGGIGYVINEMGNSSNVCV